MSQESLDLVKEWSAAAPAAWRQRVFEVLKSFEDGSWDQGRWYEPEKISAAPEVYLLKAGNVLQVTFRVWLEEEREGDFFVDVFQVTPQTFLDDEYDPD